MNIRLERTCTEILPGGQRAVGQPLTAVRDRPAYVLLGEPGAGKTTAFAMEAAAIGTTPISAREFVALGPQSIQAGKPLFIDGLDEMRVGPTDDKTPLDAIRRKLDELGRPAFRLSCREADWLGASDRDDLVRVSPNGDIAMLHLDALTDTQIEELLAVNHGISVPRHFVEQARDRQLDTLLGNPETLRMLANAVGSRWPDGLAETYDLACQKLVEEPNKAHRTARRRLAVDDLLAAAGHACAIQLLANIAGFALDEDAANDAYPTLAAIGLTTTDALEQAFASRLFDANDQQERLQPAHRRIAEYLGARFLAQRLDRASLPLGRIQALITAADGGVVSDLRGLHAWLATLSPSLRPSLLDADPLGIVLYGDLRRFPAEDKRRMLAALGREAQRYPWFRSQDWNAPPFGALADRETSATLLDILSSPNRDDAQESLMDCALEAISHGQPLLELGDALLAIVRDSTHWPINRQEAVGAYIRASDGQKETLLPLLADIASGRITDGDDQLLGRLLDCLYPEHLSAGEVVTYLHSPKRQSLVGHYRWFWNHRLLEKTDDCQLPALLDRLASNPERLRPSVEDINFARFAGEALTRGLRLAGSTIATERLWHWLGVGLNDGSDCYLEPNYRTQIAQWLEERPDTFVLLKAFSLRQCLQATDVLRCLIEAEHHFYHAELPPAVGSWYFEQAHAARSDEVRNYLFQKGVFLLLSRFDYTPRLLDELLLVAEQYPLLQVSIDGWLRWDWDDWRRDTAERKARRTAEATARQDDWRHYFRKHQVGIESGKAPAKVMCDLAMIYYGRFREAEGDTPVARLQSFFGDDAGITLAALAGLRRTLDRSDLPTLDEILELAADGRHHYIAEACLAGVEELCRNDADAVLSLPSALQERLVVFRLTHDYDNTPAWFAALLADRPQTVAGALIAYGKAMFAARKEHIAGIHPLAYDDAYGEVARLAAVPLLAAYPLRAKKDRLSDLAALLVAAIKHAPASEVLQTVEAKLARSSLDIAQRGHWLAAGLLLDPARYETALANYVGRNQSRAMSVAGFLAGRRFAAQELPELSETATALLIRLLGPHTTPERPEINAADLVRALIARLGSPQTASVAATFDALLALDSLRRWHAELRYRQESHRTLRREAHFRRLPAAAIEATLSNGAPANPADLQAIVVHHLRDLARSDRDSNTSGYLRYWNVDSYGRPVAPRPENDCRDRLLELLREKLRPIAVDAQPECEYRENKRADIRVSFGGVAGFNVPIEIKRESHDDLWLALRKQLIANYACDPGAQGHGIYLVFWFGLGSMPVAADGGAPPRNAMELEERLGRQLSPDERQRIDIVVIDCAPPA